MYGRSFLLVVLITAAVGCSMTDSHSSMIDSQETGFLNRTISTGGNTYHYVVWVPRDYDASRPWPVVLFLHGSGERGNDGWRQTAVGLGAEIRWNPDLVGAIVIFPQAPPDTRWLADEADFAMNALDTTMTELNGDPDRTYLTGLSIGGYGTWHLALAHPDRFAAIVPVCGGIIKPDTAQNVRTSPLVADRDDPYGWAAHQLRRIPIWIFHGGDDPIIPPSESRRMAEALTNEGADVHYTEYPGVGHNAWERAYAERQMWSWLFEQRLPR